MNIFFENTTELLEISEMPNFKRGKKMNFLLFQAKKKTFSSQPPAADLQASDIQRTTNDAASVKT